MFEYIDKLSKNWGVTLGVAILNLSFIPMDMNKKSFIYIGFDIALATYFFILTYVNLTNKEEEVKSEVKDPSACPPHIWVDLGDSTHCSKCQNPPKLD